jgi:hypothetical protein
MYLRTMTRRNADGTVVRYLQLAHNRWDPKAKRAQAVVLYNFGREEQVDREAIRRLIRSLSRLLSPEQAAQVETEARGLRFLCCRPLGGTWLLDQLWRQLHLDQVGARLAQDRKFRFPVERLLFALVAARALAPDSKRAMEDWVAHDVVVPNLPAVEVHDLYQVMDLVEAGEAVLQRRVFGEMADLLRLEVDLLFFDTTDIYFCRDEEDRAADGTKGFRAYGPSKEKRDDLPLVSIGLAVTRQGIPVRCWVWPGNTADARVIPQVKQDLIGWKLGRVVTVVDRGFTSEENLRILQRAGGHFIAGERMRAGQPAVEEALSRAGRYRTVRDNVEIKEIVVGDGEARRRFILTRNPKEAERQRRRREEVLTDLRAAINALPENARAYAAAVEHLRQEHPGRVYLTTDRRGRPAIDREKVRAAERLDGKYLVSTSDDTLSAEDVALGYRQLLQVEACFRSLKTQLEIRPVYHRLEARIRAHVTLCWLALLLARICEEKTGRSWEEIRTIMGRLSLVTYHGAEGEAQQCTETTPDQAQIFSALGVAPPPRMYALRPASPSTSA